MASLSILDNVSVASPCDASWDEMKGTNRVRHCAACDKKVFNLSGMTRREAEVLLVSTQGRLCVRYFRRKDGTILTQDCPVGAQKLAKRMKLAAWATAGAAVVSFAAATSAAAFLDAKACRAAVDAVRTIDAVDVPVAGGLAPPPDRAVMGEAPPLPPVPVDDRPVDVVPDDVVETKGDAVIMGRVKLDPR